MTKEEDDEVEHIIVIDYTNTFNSIDKYGTIRNISKLDIGKTIPYCIKTYLELFNLNVDGKDIKNKCDAPQRCLLSITLFSVGLMEQQ